MQITKVIGTEETLPGAVGAGTSLDSATVVRLYAAASTTVGVATEQGAADTRVFTMAGDSVEFLQKAPNDVIFSGGTVLATKVAFTN